MRKATRLFEIIQILRMASRPVTAADMAAQLEVTPRSIYRDVAALQAMRVPIEGGRGIGYILRPGFTLPPLMFSIEETEALVLALALLERIGDTSLKKSAVSISRKLAASMPELLRKVLETTALHAWGSPLGDSGGMDLERLRLSIREEEVMAIDYVDAEGRHTCRHIRPLALIYYTDWVNIVAWCDLRRDFRNFRADRLERLEPTGLFFRGDGEKLRKNWMDGWSSRLAASVPR